MDKQDRQRLDAVLSYPEDTAGGLLTDTVTVRENLTLEVVGRYPRQRGELPEHTTGLFVVGLPDRLLDPVDHAAADRRQQHARLASDGARGGRFGAHLIEVAAAFARYNLIAAPVVMRTAAAGASMVDDVVDVIREQADHQ